MMDNPKDIRPFDHIWQKVILPVSKNVYQACDLEFAEYCGLEYRADTEWKGKIYRRYLELREQLKDICYGPSDLRSAEELLDGRKIAAVLCATLIREKGFSFDFVRAKEYAQKKRDELSDPVAFNKWAAKNVYINYTMAYCSSLQLVYLTLIHDLLLMSELEKCENNVEKTEREETAKKMAILLNQQGRLSTYPQPEKGDGFDVNIIIGLARTDMSANDLDMFIFAMLLYQVEEHTVDSLKQKLQNNQS